MYSHLQLLLKFIQYKIKASNAKGHGMHSPFVFHFIQNLLLDRRNFYAFETIEGRRKQLLQDKNRLQIEDFGAGSRKHKHQQRRVCDIAKSSLKPSKYGQLLFRMVQHFKPVTILELGTSLGITSAYLATAKQDAKVYTMEGSKEIASVAKSNFKNLQIENIEIIEGNFDETLPPFLETEQKLDFVFIDGNHRYEPTIRYFEWLLPKTHENTILIFDDIHWSKEMETAWKQIQDHPNVTLSIDLFFIGLVFFRKENKVKQHFQINF